MKILHVVNSFKHAWSAGGAARIAYDESLALTRRGHEMTVFTTDKGLDESCNFQKNQPVKVDGIEAYYFRNLSNSLAKKGFAIPYYAPSIIARKIKEFDIIHIHELRRIMNHSVYHCASKYQIPYVLQAHGAVFPSKGFVKQNVGRIFDGLFTYKLLRHSSKVIALNRLETEQYKRMGVSEEKIVIIPNGIDMSEYDSLPPKDSFKKKFGIKNDEKIVLYVGRIHERKGLGLLAHAFKIVSKNVKNVRLVVVGPDDGYGVTFSMLTSELGLDEKVLFTGFVENRDKMAALVDSDVFVTPLFWGFPLTFLEACVAGCPIVTASNELDWINNNVGYVTEYSSDALAKGVTNLLQDEQTHRRFQNNCRHIIQKFNLSTVTRQLEKVYKEACSCGYY